MPDSPSNRKSSGSGTFAIIVSGGPAPGINSVIASSTIEAVNRGYRVFGFQDGFRGAVSGDPSQIVELRIPDVSPIAESGGSILGSSRYNPFLRSEDKKALAHALHEYGIDKLIVIGGEGSAYLSSLIVKEFPNVRVMHVPKTIDNDLVLPHNHPSFGFETARYAGACILKTLAVDARTTKSFFLVTSMGRRAGFLALGLGLASGSMLTLIPEEFSDHLVTPNEVATIIVNAMRKRIEMRRPFGVMIVAEGVIERIDPASCPVLESCPRDSMGRISLSQIELDDVLMPSINAELARYNLHLKLNCKNIGYELRCYEPISFDVEYTKFLGFGAVELLLNGVAGAIVTRDFDKLDHQPLSNIVKEGKVLSRCVDLTSDMYRVAKSFMIR